jgi:hypothetical protein
MRTLPVVKTLLVILLASSFGDAGSVRHEKKHIGAESKMMRVSILEQTTAAILPSSLANLSFWFKADAGVQTSGSDSLDGEAVDTWINQSTNTVNLEQATSGDRPTYQTNEINGYPVVRFAGSGDTMFTSSVTLAQPLTYFYVIKLTAQQFGYIVDGLLQNDSGAVFQNGAGGLDVQLSAGGSGLGVTYATTPTVLIVTMNFNGTSSRHQVNNGTAATGNAGTRTPNGLRFSGRASGANTCPFDIAEFISFNRILSASEEAGIEQYLANKYAVTLN